jgi:hypothetical protein
VRSVLLLTVLMFGTGAAQADGLIYLGAGIFNVRNTNGASMVSLSVMLSLL